MIEKQCYKCGSTEGLMPKAIGGNGKLFICNPCNSTRMKQYYAEGKRIVIEHYGGRCECCGEDNILFLSVDHVNNDGNTHRWKNGNRITGVHLYRKIIKDNFPPTYQILCMNCNFGKHMNNGTCPHNVV